jgi:hypothetical protein
MVEYGNGVGQVVGGSGGPSMDVGASLSELITDSVQTISTTPPGILVLAFVIIVVGLMMLKRVL